MASRPSDYYSRTTDRHVDGTPIFQKAEDRRSETEIAHALSARWHCQIRSLGQLAPIDFYAERAGRPVALLELKSRSHASDKYPTVFLNVRKWLSLLLGSIGFNTPSLFVVRFRDGVRYISVTDVEPWRQKIAGCNQIVKSRNDIEPVIEVPVAAMTAIPGVEMGAMAAGVTEATVRLNNVQAPTETVRFDTFLDGTPIFKTPQLEEKERETAAWIGAAWNCSLQSFGRLAPLEWYAVRNNRMEAILEIQCWPHEASAFPAVYVPKRKWDSLHLGSDGLKLPAILVARFRDEIRWINVRDIPLGNIRTCGLNRDIVPPNSTGPMVEVPLSAMKPLDH